MHAGEHLGGSLDIVPRRHDEVEAAEDRVDARIDRHGRLQDRLDARM